MNNERVFAVVAPMGRLIRFLLAGIVGAIFGRFVYPRIVGLAATMLGRVLDQVGTTANVRGHSLIAALVVLTGVVLGTRARLRALRTQNKRPVRPWLSRWAFVQFAIGVVVVGACLRSGSTSEWIAVAAALAAWLSVWAGMVVCAALALTAGLRIMNERDPESRWPALVAPCVFFTVVPFATPNLLAFNEVVEMVRTNPEILVTAMPARVSLLQSSPITCRVSFTNPKGSHYSTYQHCRIYAQRCASPSVSPTQLVDKAVTEACGVPREDPRTVFRNAVNRFLIYEGNECQEPYPGC